MEQNQEKPAVLPENAYRKLKDGEEYQPVMPANSKFPEVTAWSVGMGLLMAVVFFGSRSLLRIKNWSGF